MSTTKIEITPRIFANISKIDIEGRYGLQGSDMRPLFLYLKQYIQAALMVDSPDTESTTPTIHDTMISLTPDVQSKLNQFSDIITDMQVKMDVIESIDNVDQLEKICTEYAQNIIDLPIGHSFYMFGGWHNKEGSSHGMSYQLEKTSSGLRFSIYNGGAGLYSHDKVADKKSNRYYPVKIYDIKKPESGTYSANSMELKILFKRLIISMLPNHPERKKTYHMFVWENMYVSIEQSMAALQASLIDAKDVYNNNLTSLGILSNTCGQASIQQHLKIHLNSLNDYQRVIVDYKIYTLRDFINTYQAPREQYLNTLIQKFIENTLKIIQDSEAFNPDEKINLASELIAIKNKITDEPTRPISNPMVMPNLPEQPSINLPPKPSITTPIEDESSQSNMIYTKHPKIISISSTDTVYRLREKLNDIITIIERVQHVYPMWVIQQIQLVILSLPLPDNMHQFDQEPQHVYKLFTTDDLDRMKENLKTLQTYYNAAYKREYNTLQLPVFIVIQLSFIALLDYCDSQYGRLTGQPTIHNDTSLILGVFLTNYQYCPQLATHESPFDNRLAHIKTLYPTQDNLTELTQENTTSNQEYIANIIKHLPWLNETGLDVFLKDVIEELDKNACKITFNEFISIARSFHWLSYYQRTIENKPSLKKYLETYYDENLAHKMTPYDGSIRKHKFQNVQSLFEASVLSDNIYDEIHSRIQLETVIMKCLYSCLNNKERDSVRSNITFTWFYDLPPSLFYLKSPITAFYNSTISIHTPKVYGLIDSQYRLSTSAASHVINQDNPIDELFWKAKPPQKLSVNEAQLKARSKLEAQLFQLRTSLTFQIPLTLTHFTFKSSLKQLIDPNLQSYVEATVLDPCAQSEDMNILLNQFVITGLNFFTNPATHLLSYEAIFFIRLQYNFNKTNDPKALENNYEQINQYLLTQTNPKIINALHQYRFLTAMSLYNRRIITDFMACYESYIQTEYHSKISQDKVTASDIHVANSQFKQWLASLPPSEQPVTHSNAIEMKKIPMSLQGHFLLKQMGLENETQCLLSPDERTVTFLTKGANLSFIWHEPEGWEIQRNGYKFYPQRHIKHTLPRVFDDQRTQIWVNVLDNNDVIITRNHILCYQRLPNGTLQQIGKSGNLGILTYELNDLIFTVFESLSFITCLTYDNGARIIDFERYGLTLHQESNKDCYLAHDPQYKLQPHNTSPFAPNVACLNFINDNGTHHCLVAVQPFYIDYKTVPGIGDYYPLIQNTTKAIPDTTSHDENTHYDHTEKFITYDVIKQTPIPHTPAEALYLCYLYLATHDIEQAWHVLQQLNDENNLTGHPDELTYLYWIIHKLPQRLNTNQTDTMIDDFDEAESISSEHIACQLKAIALFTQWMQQGNQSKITSTTKTFHDNLHDTIIRMYQTYQKRRPQLPKFFKLNDDECRSLLNYHQIKGTEWYVGSLDYDRALLQLKEWHAIEKSLMAMRPLSSAHEKRLQTIQKYMADFDNIEKMESFVDNFTIDLSLPSSIPDYLSDLTKKHPMDKDIYSSLLEFPTFSILNRYRDREAHDDQAIAALSSNISLIDFMNYFPNFVNIALGKTNSLAYQNQLKTFCTYILIGHHKLTENKITSFLANILYRLLENSEFFSQPGVLNEQTSLQELFDLLILHTTGTEPVIVSATETAITNLHLKTPTPIYWSEPRLHYIEEIMVDSRTLLQELRTAIPEQLLRTPTSSEDPLLYMIAPLSNYDDLEATYHSMSTTIISEKEAGLLKYQYLQAQRNNAEKVITITTIQELKTTAQTLYELASQKTTSEWTKAQIYAHHESTNKALAHHIKAEIAARRRITAKTKNHLLTLYINQSMINYKEMTTLTDDTAVQYLHQQIHRAITLELQQQQLKRLIQLLNQTPPDHAKIMHCLKNNNIVQHDPDLMRLQLDLNILLRQNQAKALHTLLTQPELMKALPMGIGKTKVIIPTLAYKIADGTHFVVVEYPRALLETNYIDHRQTALKLFNQKTILFHFDRDSDCSVETLANIYNHFERMIVRKQVLITVGESMQSLELQYKEILLSQPTGQSLTDTCREQLYYLNHILRLLRERSQVIIDEAHEGLAQNKTLNFTLGQPEASTPSEIHHSIELFQFINTLSLARYNNTKMIKHLVHDANSPLQAYIKDFSPDQVQLYLNNKSPTDHRFLHNLSRSNPKIKNTLAFYKNQLTPTQPSTATQPAEPSLLEKSLTRRYMVDYGPSESADKSSLKKALAIPYDGNNNALEGSRFGNHFMEINCTIQSFLHSGLNKELFIDVIKQWKADALTEHSMKKQIDVLLNKTNYTLAMIDLDNDTNINCLFQLVQHDQDVIYYILQHHLLPLVTIEHKTLSSNAHHHVDLYHKVTAITGTPDNKSSYHQRLALDIETSKGNDAYILSVLQSKNTQIHAIGMTSISNCLETLEDTRETLPPLHAIIDVCARFEGIPNQIVAQQLAKFIRIRNPKIKYILYYQNNILSALSVHPPYPSITIGSSDTDVILQKLGGCQVENYLTYYDQKHTIGTDITQNPQGRAIVFADDQQSFMQGCTRMRDYESNQTIELIIPKKLGSEITLNQLHDRIQKNIMITAKHAAVGDTLNKMDNLIHNHLMKTLLAIDPRDTEKQIEFSKRFETYFVKTKSKETLFEQFGQIDEEVESALIFNNRVSQLLNTLQLIESWKASAQIGTKNNPSLNESSTMRATLNNIIKQAKLHCDEYTYYAPKRPQNNIIRVINNIQQQQETKQFQETKSYVENQEEDEEFRNNKHLLPRAPAQIISQPMNTYCHCQLFSKNFLATVNYAYVYEEQKDMLNYNLKPINIIHFILIYDQIQAHLVTNQEAEEIKKNLNFLGNNWLSTLNGHILAGNRPEDILGNQNYRSLMEQIYYFNGQLDYLLENENKESLCWLTINSSNKLDFYATHIAPYRASSISAFRELRTHLVKPTALVTTHSSTANKADTQQTPKSQSSIFNFFNVANFIGVSSKSNTVDHTSTETNKKK